MLDLGVDPYVVDLENRVKNASNILYRWGQVDGSHHQAWVIDQVLRALCGCEIDFEDSCPTGNQEYMDWVHDYCYEDGVYEYEWDTGIAP